MAELLEVTIDRSTWDIPENRRVLALQDPSVLLKTDHRLGEESLSDQEERICRLGICIGVRYTFTGEYLKAVDRG